MTPGDVRQFEWAAPLYDRLAPGFDPTTLAKALELAERPIESVLDIGGGTGRATRAVSAERRVVADPSRGMLTQARGDGLGVLQADGARLPVEDECVDVVLVVDALHHISDQGGALEEAQRVLRPDGILFVAEFDPTTVRGRLLVAAERLVRFDSTFRPPSELHDLLTDRGFDPVILERGFAYAVAGRPSR